YHAVGGVSIGGLVDGGTHTVANPTPSRSTDPPKFQLKDSSRNLVQFDVSPRVSWGGKALDFKVRADPTTLDLRKQAFTPSVSGNTIDLGYAHGFVTGMKVTYFNGGAANTNIGSLTSGSSYYVKLVPNQPTKLQLTSDSAGNNLVTISSAGSGSAHAFFPAVADGDALVYSQTLGLKIGLTNGSTYYAITN